MSRTFMDIDLDFTYIHIWNMYAYMLIFFRYLLGYVYVFIHTFAFVIHIFMFYIFLLGYPLSIYIYIIYI
jgi:hypothetical protein